MTTLQKLNPRPNFIFSKNRTTSFKKLELLISELETLHLHQNVQEAINLEIYNINRTSLLGKEFVRMLNKSQAKILKIIKKEHGIVPKNYYANLWSLFGVSGLGIPIGIGLGKLLNNMRLFVLGIPLGIGLASLIGLALDKKAFKEGRQLKFSAT